MCTRSAAGTVMLLSCTAAVVSGSAFLARSGQAWQYCLICLKLIQQGLIIGHVAKALQENCMPASFADTQKTGSCEDPTEFVDLLQAGTIEIIVLHLVGFFGSAC